jgi:hypothetical protein
VAGRPRIRDAITANWPTKLTALALATILWAAVAAEQPSSLSLAVSLELSPPPPRPLAEPLPAVHGTFAGSARELLKLYASPPVLRVPLPDSGLGSTWTVQLVPEDIEIAEHLNVRAERIDPGMLTLIFRTDRVAAKPAPGRVSERVLMGIPVAIRGARSGGSWTSDPPAVIVMVRGPAARLSLLTRDSVDVSAFPEGSGQAETVRLDVTSPPGVEARALPDTAVVRRRTSG